ncbi:protein FAM151B isoform X7 [Catharus ustulatus]|uniref:protein FAM151B isoform X7 n=1 Tax=Catharus ustulatus TaxID=91951 RepID=UPI00140AA39C|nr:protein FAM151B isoform X7 [Catharus ustulatus]
MASGPRGSWSEWPVDHFLRTGSIGARDGAAVRWFHAANSRARAAEAARSDVHMVEVDVQLRGGHEEPVLAHPPDTDSDITLQEWLAQVASTAKGIKLDFKSLAAVGPSLELLGRVGPALASPVWLNGDVLPGPCGSCAPLDARAFLRAVTASCPEATLSLGWTTAWQPGQDTPSLSGQERKMCILWKTCSSSEKTLIKVGFITTFLSHRTLNSKKPLESNAECRAGNAWPCHALYCEPL